MLTALGLAPADIPSPSSGTWEIGPLSLNAYGLMIALGVVAAVWLFGRRLEAKGIGTRDDANAIAIWAVVAGVVGARLYHVVTDWSLFQDDYSRIFRIWEGGLGIPGALVLGGLVGAYVTGVRRGIPLGPAFNAVAPAVPLAQAIGRWGNYFNQELFGRPTDLPWALEVSPETALEAGYPPGTTFHPTFLYESLSNLVLCGLLLWIDKRFNPAGGRLMAMYVVGYGAIRFWVEGLRIDPADELGGLRWNQWVALAAIVGGGLYLVATRDKPKDILVPAGAGGPAGAIAADGLGDASHDAGGVDDPDREAVDAELIEDPEEIAWAATQSAAGTGDDDDIVDAEVVDDSVWDREQGKEKAGEPEEDSEPEPEEENTDRA